MLRRLRSVIRGPTLKLSRQVSGLQSGFARDRLIRHVRAARGNPPRPQRSIMQLKISSRNVDGILVISCSGRIVFGEESSLLRDTVKQAIQDNKKIVLNLGEVNYIDSGGLGTLVSLHTTAYTAGATIKLANLTKRVGDLLQVTKLLTVFDVHSSEYDALESFRRAA